MSDTMPSLTSKPYMSSIVSEICRTVIPLAYMEIILSSMAEMYRKYSEKVFYDKIKNHRRPKIMANRKKEVYKPKPMTEGKRNVIQGLLREYDIQTAEDIQDALKDLCLTAPKTRF